MDDSSQVELFPILLFLPIFILHLMRRIQTNDDFEDHINDLNDRYEADTNPEVQCAP